MEELKTFIKANSALPFMIKKNVNKYYKGYSHAIYLQYSLRRHGILEKLDELGFVHTSLIAVSGKYSVRVYIKKVSNEPLPPTPQDMYLWVCPECGKSYYIDKDDKYKIKSFSYNRTVCNDCILGVHPLYEKFQGIICDTFEVDK